MNRFLKRSGIVLGVVIYIAMGVNIGKTTYEMWHGQNGFAALKNAEPPVSQIEIQLRSVLFAFSAVTAESQIVNAKASHTAVRNPPVPEILGLFGSNKLGYVWLHAFIGLPKAVVAYVLVNFCRGGIFFLGILVYSIVSAGDFAANTAFALWNIISTV